MSKSYQKHVGIKSSTTLNCQWKVKARAIPHYLHIHTLHINIYTHAHKHMYVHTYIYKNMCIHNIQYPILFGKYFSDSEQLPGGLLSLSHRDRDLQRNNYSVTTAKFYGLGTEPQSPGGEGPQGPARPTLLGRRLTWYLPHFSITACITSCYVSYLLFFTSLHKKKITAIEFIFKMWKIHLFAILFLMSFWFIFFRLFNIRFNISLCGIEKNIL